MLATELRHNLRPRPVLARSCALATSHGRGRLRSRSLVMLTLHNYFHNSSARVRAGEISATTVRRVRRALCGSADCTCSGQLGTRAGYQPGQPAVDGGRIEEDYDADTGRTTYTAIED